MILPVVTMFHVFLIDSLETIEGAHQELTLKNTFELALVWSVISLPATYYGAYRGMIKQDGSAEPRGKILVQRGTQSHVLCL